MELKFLKSTPTTVGVLATTVRCEGCRRTVRVRTMYPGQNAEGYRCCGK